MRIIQLRLKNFKMFRDVVINDIPPLAVFVGANGTGKSTLCESFQFLRDSLTHNIPHALRKHGNFEELRTRWGRGAIEIGLRAGMKVSGKDRVVDYSVQVGDGLVEREVLRCGDVNNGRRSIPLVFESKLNVSSSSVRSAQMKIAASGPNSPTWTRHLSLAMDERNLALKFLGLVKDKNLAPANALREGIEDWHLSDLRTDSAGADTKTGAKRLSASGDNLTAVMKFMEKNHPSSFGAIQEKLTQRVPGIEQVSVEDAPDGGTALKFHDSAWKTRPFSARQMSGGTIKALAYLVLLNDPSPHPLLCVEEPENQLYPTLLVELLEEFRDYAKWKNAQVFLTTHSPDLLDAAKPEEVFWLSKKRGVATVHRAKDNEEISRMMKQGDVMGRIWRINKFEGAKPS